MKRKITILILCFSSLCFNCKVKAQDTTDAAIISILHDIFDLNQLLVDDLIPNTQSIVDTLDTLDDLYGVLGQNDMILEELWTKLPLLQDILDTTQLLANDLIPNTQSIVDILSTLEGLSGVLPQNDMILEALWTLNNNLHYDSNNLLVYDPRSVTALNNLADKIQQIVDNTSGGTGDGSGDTPGGSGNPETGGGSGDGSTNCTCAEDLIEYYDGSFFPNFYEKFNSFSLSPQSYKFVSWVDLQSVDTDVEQETTTENIPISGDNFFAAITSYLDLLSRQQSVDNKSLVMIYKVLKGEDKSEEEQEIKNQVSQIQSQKDSLEGSFTFIEELGSTINFESYTDQIKIDGNGLNLRQIFGSGSLESSIYLGSFPSRFGDIDISGFNIDLDISGFLPYFEVARSCFSVIYWLLIATFIIFIFRKVYPLLYNLISFVSNVLPTK